MLLTYVYIYFTCLPTKHVSWEKWYLFIFLCPDKEFMLAFRYSNDYFHCSISIVSIGSLKRVAYFYIFIYIYTYIYIHTYIYIYISISIYIHIHPKILAVTTLEGASFNIDLMEFHNLIYISIRMHTYLYLYLLIYIYIDI